MQVMAPRKSPMRYPPPGVRGGVVDSGGGPISDAAVQPHGEQDPERAVDRLEEMVSTLRTQLKDISARLDTTEELLREAVRAQPPDRITGVAETVVPYVSDRGNALTEAADNVQRAVLLGTLVANRWNLTAAAEGLRLAGPGAVIRYIKALGLQDEYAAARERGDIKQGRPKETKD